MIRNKVFIKYVLVLFSIVTFVFANKLVNASSCQEDCGAYLGGSCTTDSVSCGSSMSGSCVATQVNKSDGMICTTYQCECFNVINQGRTLTSCSGRAGENLSCNYGALCQVDTGPGSSGYTTCVPDGSGGGSGGGPGGSTPTQEFSLSVSPSTRSIVNGESTSFTLTLTPVNTGGVGTYTLPTPIVGCPTGATCTYSGGNTMTVTQDTNSSGVDYAVPATKTVVVTASTVSPNNYTLTFSAVNSSNQTRSTPGTLIINAGINNAVCGTTITAPASVVAGQSFNATVSMLNSGSTTWTSSDARPDVAGVNNYHITASPWPSVWGNARAAVTTNIAPGATGSFTIPLVAPTTPGTYTFNVQMLQENVQWFGGNCAPKSIVVNAPTAPSISISASPTSATAPGATTVIWSATNNPTSCTATGGYGSTWAGNKAASGSLSLSGYPVGTYTFTLECTNAGGTDTKNATFTVTSPTPITVSLTPYFSSITNYPTINNNSIYWSTTGNPDSCTPSGSSPWNSAVISPVSSGSQYQGVYPSTGTYTYGIVCRKAGVPDTSANFSVVVSSTAVTQYNLTVNKTIGGNVVGNDGLINCGSTCVRPYNQGSVVTLQAVPDSVQWRFAGWGGACSGTGVCTVTIDGNKTVTAQFKPRALKYQEF